MTYANLEGIERRFGGPNGYGHKGYFLGQVPGLSLANAWEKKPGPKRTPAAHLRLKASGAALNLVLRDAVLSAKGPGILDQNPTSSCTGHAEVGSAMTEAVAAGAPFPYVLSPWAAYRLGLMVDVPPNADGTFPTMTDEGAIPEQVTRGCKLWGLPSRDDDPTDPATLNNRPPLGELEQGLKIPITDIFGLPSQTSDVEDALVASIDGGFTVKFGTLVDDAFENWVGGDPFDQIDPARVLGGHALYFCGYERVANVMNYVVANSWGTGAGEGGFWRVTGNFVRQASDLEIVKYGRLS